MNKFSRKMVKCNLKRKIHRRISILRRCLLLVWDRILACSLGKPIQYNLLPCPSVSSQSLAAPAAPVNSDIEYASVDVMGECHGDHLHCHHHDKDSDLVDLKISLLGDCQIGKTSFLAKYVGKRNIEKEDGDMDKKGLKLMDKTLMVKGARISYSLWEVGGDEGSRQQIPVACKDSVAILLMFDLTSRITLNGVIRWYQEARKWNQTAIPIMVGTKFDDFIQLPIDLQWTIASQARAYAKALNATLFFSSATYNINVNKIFKFITAKLFDLPWSLERNLTIGEPIIDF